MAVSVDSIKCDVCNRGVGQKKPAIYGLPEGWVAAGGYHFCSEAHRTQYLNAPLLPLGLSNDEVKINSGLLNYGVTPLPVGTHITTTPIYLPLSYSSLLGEQQVKTNIAYLGDDYAIKIQNANVNTPTVPDETISYNNQIKDLQIDLENASGHGLFLRKVYSGSFKRINIRYVPANKYGIHVYYSVYNLFERVNINGGSTPRPDNGSLGMYWEQDPNLNKLVLCSFANLQNGIQIKSGEVTSLDTCDFNNCEAGVWVVGAQYNLNFANCYFENNVIDLQMDHGTYTTLCVTLTNCYFGGNGVNSTHGLYIGKGVTKVTYKGCRFKGHTVAGVYLKSTATARVIDEGGNSFSEETYPIVNDSTAGGRVEHIGQYVLQHHTANDTLLVDETGSLHTNLGASGEVIYTLPADADAGIYFDFAVMVAQSLTIKISAASKKFYHAGTISTDDSGADLQISANDEGESIRAVADGNGDWVFLNAVGTWTVSQP